MFKGHDGGMRFRAAVPSRVVSCVRVELGTVEARRIPDQHGAVAVVECCCCVVSVSCRG